MEKWCEHITRTDGMEWNFCPICGTPRPAEKKVELPEKIVDNERRQLKEVMNQLIAYLAARDK